jgi:hypothetical protein
MRFDDEIVSEGECLGGHVVDVHDSLLYGVVGESKCIQEWYPHNVVADVVANPEFLKRFFRCT